MVYRFTSIQILIEFIFKGIYISGKKGDEKYTTINNIKSVECFPKYMTYNEFELKIDVLNSMQSS